MVYAGPRFCLSNAWEMVEVVGGAIRHNSLHGHDIFQDLYDAKDPELDKDGNPHDNPTL